MKLCQLLNHLTNLQVNGYGDSEVLLDVGGPGGDAEVVEVYAYRCRQPVVIVRGRKEGQ